MEKKTTPEIFEQIKYAEAQHIGYGGQRQTLEDRCKAGEVTTASGVKMYVGIVADGIGGASAGETAGQLTIDTILKSLESATEADIGMALHNAIQSAHAAVRTAARSNALLRSMGTTATVAAIANGKLYLAHVGDSRAYLVRDGKITQLTMDHTWGNEKVREGLLTMDQAHSHPRKEELARYVGANIPTLNVDLGLRLDGEADPSKSNLVQRGLNLEKGDVVLLCTDGLVKDRPNSSDHFVESDEIISWVQRSEPQDAANTLVSLALGRQVDDNVSVVLFEVPGKKKSLVALAPGSKRSLITTALLAVGFGLVVLVALVALLSGGNTATLTPEAPTLAGMTAGVDNTPAPKPGQLQVLEGTIDYQVGKANNQQVLPGENAPAGKDVRLWTGSLPARLRLEDGTILALGELTTINWIDTTDTPLINLERGKVMVVAGGARIQSRDGQIWAASKGGLAGVSYDPISGVFSLDCFEKGGPCELNGFSGFKEITPGQRLAYTGQVLGEYRPAEYNDWLPWLPGVVPPPTATPEPTATPTPTATPEPTATPTLGPTATSGGGGRDPNEPPKPPRPPEPEPPCVGPDCK